MDGTTSDSDTLDFSSTHKSLTFDFERTISTYTYRVSGASQTLSGMAASWAAAISAGGKYTATADGARLVITSTEAFTVATVNPASGSTAVTVTVAAGMATATLTLSGSAVNGEQWRLTLTTGFSVQSENGANRVSAGGIEAVAGGGADDLFVFHNGWGSYTITNAGTIDEDILDFSAVTADLIFAIHSDGTVSVTDGTNTLGASAGIEGIKGGLGNNTFVFEDGGYFDGWIEGGTGAGKNNTLDYSACRSAVAVDLWKMDVIETVIVHGVPTTNINIGRATGTTAINRIHRIVGGLSAYDTLIGPMSHNTWTLTGANSGTVNSISFSGFENLTGTADYNDSFIFNGGSVTGTLSGHGSDRSAGIDTIDIRSGSFTNVVYRAYSNVGTAVVSLVGDATNLEQWKITLTDDRSGTATTYAYTVSGATTTLGDVASFLAAQINANSPTAYAPAPRGTRSSSRAFRGPTLRPTFKLCRRLPSRAMRRQQQFRWPATLSM